MVTDNQRRDVAAKMRELYRLHPNEYLDVMIARAMRKVLGYDPALPYALAFADLIDRPKCSMEYMPEYSGDELYPTEAYKCSACGWIVSEGMPSYCPSCGAEVIDENGAY